MDLRAELQALFQDFFEDEDLILEDHLTAEDIEDWDSLAHIGLIATIEKKYNIKFATAEISRLKNVGELISLTKKALE